MCLTFQYLVQMVGLLLLAPELHAFSPCGWVLAEECWGHYLKYLTTKTPAIVLNDNCSHLVTISHLARTHHKGKLDVNHMYIKL